MATKDWEEYSKKQVIVGRVTKEVTGDYHVYLSIDDAVKASVSISFGGFDKAGKYYELVLDKGENQRISIPVSVKAMIYYEKL